MQHVIKCASVAGSTFSLHLLSMLVYSTDASPAPSSRVCWFVERPVLNFCTHTQSTTACASEVLESPRLVVSDEQREELHGALESLCERGWLQNVGNEEYRFVDNTCMRVRCLHLLTFPRPHASLYCQIDKWFMN